MPRHGRHPAELRERAMRVLSEAEQHVLSLWTSVRSMADKLGPKPASA